MDKAIERIPFATILKSIVEVKGNHQISESLYE